MQSLLPQVATAAALSRRSTSTEDISRRRRASAILSAGVLESRGGDCAVYTGRRFCSGGGRQAGSWRGRSENEAPQASADGWAAPRGSREPERFPLRLATATNTKTLVAPSASDLAVIYLRLYGSAYT